MSEALIFALSTNPLNMTKDCSLNYKFNTWIFQAQTWGEHVVYRNCFWHSKQFLYTTCYCDVLQKEELLTKIYLYSETTDGKQFDILLEKVADRGRTLYRLFQAPSHTIVKGAGLIMKAIIEEVFFWMHHYKEVLREGYRIDTLYFENQNNQNS